MSEHVKNGWTRVAFGDAVRLCRDRSANPTADGFNRYVGLEHLDPGELMLRRWGNVEDGTTFTTVFRAGQVLFGKRRAYQRKVAVADFDGVCSGDIYVLESLGPKLLLPDLLPFICETDRFFEHAVGTSAGSLSPRTNWQSLASFEFALPPLEEQLRIVQVLGAIGQCREAFLGIKNVTSLLMKTIGIDAIHEANGEEQLLSDHYTVASGQVDPRQTEYAGLPLVAPNHIEGGTGRLLKLESASAQAAISGKYLFDEGDVLYSKIRPNLMKATIAPCRGLCSADMYVLTPKDSLRADYLLAILLAHRFTRFAISGSARTGIPKLNREHLCQYRCHLPSLEEQDLHLSSLRALQLAAARGMERVTALSAMKATISEYLNK